MIEKTLELDTGDSVMPVTVRHPSGAGPFPLVFIYHDAPGIQKDMNDISRRFAEAGYYAVLPDLYHRLGKNITFDLAGVAEGPGSPVFTKLAEAAQTLVDDVVLADSAALLDVLAGEEAVDLGRRGTIGFCMGARYSLRLLASSPQDYQAGSILYPTFTVTDAPDSAHLSVHRIRAEMFVGLAGADILTPLEAVKPLRDELARPGVNATVEVFDGVDHGYFTPSYPHYDHHAATVTWERTLEIFDRALRLGSQ